MHLHADVCCCVDRDTNNFSCTWVLGGLSVSRNQRKLAQSLYYGECDKEDVQHHYTDCTPGVYPGFWSGGGQRRFDPRWRP